MVLQRLRRGDAATFVSVATQLALGSQRALSGRSIRARVALALSLPIGIVNNVDALALALISRQDSSRDWLRAPATGSLPSRRLAARLLERAAREAARRAAEGDDTGIRVFCTPAVREAWERLLADRETLVWRHVASARGLLGSSMPIFREEMRRHLDPEFTITEWRRAAASLAASIAVEPEEGLRACRELLESVVFQQDHGIAAAMIAPLAADPPQLFLLERSSSANLTESCPLLPMRKAVGRWVTILRCLTFMQLVDWITTAKDCSC